MIPLLSHVGVPRVVPITATMSQYRFLLPCPKMLQPYLVGRKRVRDASVCSNQMFVSRCQLPLLPSYAVTVHKIQGLTLPRLVIDLVSAAAFPGGAYVGISRVRRLSDLYITGDRITLRHFKPDLLFDRQYDRLTRLSEVTIQQHNATKTAVTTATATITPSISLTNGPLLQTWYNNA